LTRNLVLDGGPGRLTQNNLAAMDDLAEAASKLFAFALIYHSIITLTQHGPCCMHLHPAPQHCVSNITEEKERLHLSASIQ